MSSFVRSAGRAALLIFGLAVGLALLVAALFAWAETDPGRAFVARQAALVTPHSGLRVRIGRIDGALATRFTAHDVVLSDPTGAFLTIPAVTVAWHPLAYATANRLELFAVTAPLARVTRVPKFLPSLDPNQPILPNFDILLGRLRVARIEIAPAVAGRALVANLSAHADVAHGRAVVRASAATDAADRLALDLDSRPDDDRFSLTARVDAPATGLIAALTGIARPVTLAVDGKGSWTHWRGTLAADLAAAPLARLALGAEGGAFTAKGTLAPAALTGPGLVAQLSGPELAIDARGTMASRVLTLIARADAPAISIAANGTLDLAASTTRAAINGRLLRAAALSPQLSGPPIAFDATVTGPLTTPVIDARAAAPFARAGNVAVIAPRLAAHVALGAGPLTIPLKVSATRVDGLGAQVSPLVQNLSITGPLTLASGVLRSDRLLIATTRANARVGLTYTLASGAYIATVDGALPRYAVAGFGVADLTARIRATPGPRGRGIAVAGPFAARVIRLDNPTVRQLAGGLPVVTGTANLAANGFIRADALRIAAPRLNLAGSASLAPGGALAANLSGHSADYGPIALTVSGTTAKPAATLALAKPGLGLGLADLRADVHPSTNGFAVNARGASQYGPFVADIGIVTVGPALAVDIRALTLAGITARGHVVAVGPVYAGDLALTGQGVTGDVRLANQAGVQRADLALAFVKARLVATKPTLTVASGRVAASVLLPRTGLEGTATVDVVGLKRDTLTLTRLAARGGYAQGQGTAYVQLAGEANAPFALTADIAANAQRVTVAASGDVDGEPIRLAAPAVLTRAAAGWTLAPATLMVADGKATLSGRSGADTQLSARLDNLHLDALSGLGALNVRGFASGTASLTLPASGLPQGTAQLFVTRFSRAALSTNSLPIDIEAAAALRGNAAAARGFIRRDGKVLGAFQAQLTPIAGGDQPALTRLLAAPLRGEVRLQAPAEAIWPLAGVDALDVRGPVAVSASLSGHLNQPNIAGTIRANGARAEAATLGTVITGIELDGRFDGPALTLTRFTGKVGDGTIAATGRVALTDTQGFTADLQAKLANARILKTDVLTTAVTGPARLQLDRSGGLISGDVRIDSGRYQLGTTPAEAVPELKVREVGARPPSGRPPEDTTTLWRLALHAAARSRLNVRGLGLDSDWGADVRIGGTALEPSITGRATLARGNFDFSGKTFRLDRGEVRFTGEFPPNPSVDIQATANVTGLTAVLTIGGSAFKPEIAFTSTPALPEDEVLSRLLFGTSVTNLSAPEALQLAAAVAQLRGGSGGGLNPVNTVRRLTGIDRLRVNGADKTTGRGTSVAAGKYIGRNIYVEVASDAKGYTATQIELSLTRWLSVLSTVASQGSNSVAVRVSKDY